MIRYHCPLLTNPFSIFFNIITLNKMKIAVDITQKKEEEKPTAINQTINLSFVSLDI
jgi:hypothetical protein